MEKPSIVHIGGDVEKAVLGQYSIKPKAVLQEAWKLTQGARSAINLALILVLVIGTLVSLLVSQYLGGFEAVFADPGASLIVNIVVTVAIWPFLAGIEMMGILHAVGLKTQPKLVFAFLKRGSWVAVCAVFTSLLISLGLQLLVIPGIFLAVALSLTVPLVVEKKMTPMQAIILSVKALRFQWFNIFFTYLALVAALILIILPMALLQSSQLIILGVVFFIVALSYLAPFYYNVKGILYREIFGMKLHTVNQEHAINDDTFIA